MAFWAAAAPGIAAGVAGLIGGERANQANARAVNAQVAFQREMSNSQHQRQVADLKKAGLNPILSANGGASVPQGAAPQITDSVGSGLASAAEGVRLGMEAKSQKLQNDNLKSTNALINAQTAKTATEAKVLGKGIPKAEITNDIYDLFRPYIKKMKDGLGSSSKQQHNDKAKQQFQQLIQKGRD